MLCSFDIPDECNICTNASGIRRCMRCTGCKLCQECHDRIRFSTQPFCPTCKLPAFDIDQCLHLLHKMFELHFEMKLNDKGEDKKLFRTLKYMNKHAQEITHPDMPKWTLSSLVQATLNIILAQSESEEPLLATKSSVHTRIETGIMRKPNRILQINEAHRCDAGGLWYAKGNASVVAFVYFTKKGSKLIL